MSGQPDPEPAEARGGGAADARFAAAALDWPAVRALLAAYCPSPLGRRALETLAPRTDGEARAALSRGGELLELAPASGTPPLDGGGDPFPALDLALRYSRTLGGEELLAVARFARLASDVSLWIAARRGAAPACAALWADAPDLAALEERLSGALDERGRVRDDASPLLKRLRREIDVTTQRLERTMRALASRPALRSALADGPAARVHRRGGRLVLAVRTRHAGKVQGVVHDRSQTGETLFVEPHSVVAEGNRLAESQADAEREESRILVELTRAVLERRADLARVGLRVAELELALVSARFARATEGRPARLPGDAGAHGGMLLRAFRHPLLLAEQRQGRLAEVVPLDLRLGEEFDLLVITGPNTGGKTLALKSAGLAVLMTRLGFALPCDEGTTVPLYEGIAADIGDEQEIQQNLSTFSSHLQRIRAGLDRAGPRTLFLLDELGGGTDPAEGAALGDAILEALHEGGCPTLASTHLGKLKEFAFRHARAENAHVEFDLATLAPRYRLVIGAPGESRALAIARRLGFPPAIVDRAAQRLERKVGDAERLIEAVRDVRVDAERLRSEAEERLAELETRLAAQEEAQGELRRRRAQVEAEAQRGLEERLARARAWVDRGEALLHRLPPAQRAEVAELVLGLREALGDALLTERRQSFLEGLRKGEHVWLPRFKKRCQVVRIHKERRELEVRLGKHDLRVSFDDVTFYESL